MANLVRNDMRSGGQAPIILTLARVESQTAKFTLSGRRQASGDAAAGCARRDRGTCRCAMRLGGGPGRRRLVTLSAPSVLPSIDEFGRVAASARSSAISLAVIAASLLERHGAVHLDVGPAQRTAHSGRQRVLQSAIVHRSRGRRP